MHANVQQKPHATQRMMFSAASNGEPTVSAGGHTQQAVAPPSSGVKIAPPAHLAQADAPSKEA